MVQRPYYSDAQVLASEPILDMLAAVAEGRITRDLSGRAIIAPCLLDGEDITMSLRSLMRHDLVHVPLHSPVSLEPRGERLLAISEGRPDPWPPGQ